MYWGVAGTCAPFRLCCFRSFFVICSNAVMSQILRRYPDTFLKEVAEIDFLTSFPRRGCTDMLLLPPKPHSRRPSAPSDCNNGRALGRTKSFNGIDEAATPQKGLQRATRKAGPACTLAPASCLSAMDISEREDSEWVFLDLFGRASQEETKVSFLCCGCRQLPWLPDTCPYPHHAKITRTLCSNV